MGKRIEEMCRAVTGHGAWHIGELWVADGPHGIRAQEDGAKNNNSHEATCFPTAGSAACSWNRELIGKISKSTGCVGCIGTGNQYQTFSTVWQKF